MQMCIRDSVMAIIVPENMISDIMSGENTPVEVVCQSEGVNLPIILDSL